MIDIMNTFTISICILSILISPLINHLITILPKKRLTALPAEIPTHWKITHYPLQFSLNPSLPLLLRLRFLATELLLPITCGIIATQTKSLTLLPLFCIIAISFIITFWTDVEAKIISNKITATLIVIGIALNIITKTLLFSAYGIGLMLGLFIVIFLISKLFSKGSPIGAGDIKLAIAFGAIWGPKFALLSIYISLLLSMVVIIVLILLKKKKKDDDIAFGPFMITGATITQLWGAQIWAYLFPTNNFAELSQGFIIF